MPWGWVWLGGSLLVGFYAGVMLMSLLAVAKQADREFAHAERPVAAQEASMSQRDVERALGRLATDDEFRREFYRDPPRACVALGIRLTEEEIQALVATPRSVLADVAGCLDDRICRLHLPCLVSPAKGEQEP